MNKKQALGQLRELLSAAGAALATWGYTDGHGWSPVIGCALILYSLSWGWLHHRDPANPGTVSWSMVRKAVNVIGAACVTYGFVEGSKISSLEPLLGVLGPILALRYSWVSNAPLNPEDDPTVP